MSADEIIDVDLDPAETRRVFRRRCVRYGVPFTGIALIAAGLIISALYTSAMNRADVLALSGDFITTLNEQVHTEVRAYLAPARDAVVGLAAALPDDPMSDAGRATFERIAHQLLRNNEQLAAAFFGMPDGAFLMVQRNAEGSADTKLMRRDGDTVGSTWTRRDANGDVVAIETDEADTYDPRTRGWFQDAMRTDGVSWSRVYIFFTDKAPGITASAAVRRHGGSPAAVIGVDIRLKSLSELLQNLQTRARGTLAIINAGGEVIAFHDPNSIMQEADDGVRPKTVRELGQPELAEAFDRLRVEGPGRGVVNIDGVRFIYGSASLRQAVSRDWWLMLLAPESAYLGFVAANGRRGLFASSAVVVLAIVLAVMLVAQGVIADRDARRLRTDSARLEAEREVYGELSGLANLSDPADPNDLARASEILTRAEGAQRVSIWRLVADESSLVCIDAYDKGTRGHTSGMVLQTADCAELLAAVRDGQAVEVNDAQSDPRTASLYLSYLQASGTSAFHATPIMLSGKLLGAVLLGDVDPADALASRHGVARAIANLLAPRLRRLADADAHRSAAASKSNLSGTAAGSDRFAGALSDGEALRTATLVELRAELAGADQSEEATAASVFPTTTVLALKLLNDRVLAAGLSGDHGSAVFREVVDAFEVAARDRGIPYVKVLTDTVVAVDGFGDDMEAAAERLVDVALAVRERCATIFLTAGEGLQFAMGMDSGEAFGVAVGSAGGLYNIWGETVRIAVSLADTAEPGTIQVSEATYELLREECVFRRRGAFFVDQIGEMTTFTLRGRL